MFEFEQFDPKVITQVAHPALDAETQKRFGPARIQSNSLMNWGEHCTECAFPSCYTTCSFYQPRQDGRCRRFTFGIFRSATPRSWMNYSALVHFKNWSQLWAQGNATQLPGFITTVLECSGAAAWTLSAPFDWLLQKTTGRKRLSIGLQSLRRRVIRMASKLYRHFPKPDCLLIEVFNPMPIEAHLHLRIKGKGPAGRFEWTDRAPGGFSSFAIPTRELERSIDLGQPFEMALTVREEDGKSLYFCSATFVRMVDRPKTKTESAIQATGKKVKCVVWDLDNTLWDGVLVEGQPAEFKLKDGLRTLLTELDRRGILLSIASKNSEEDARKLLEALGIWELFLAPQIHWKPKSTSLKQIAERLNLGLDALAFVDDMPFERDEVAATLPMITLVPAEQALAILGRPEFAGDASGEGSARRLSYQTELKREQAMADTGLDYDAFLATCEIRISIKRPDDELLPRIYDIVQRTNQLNIATQRYELEELRALIHNPAQPCYIVSCADKYGDYGHVGFIVLARDGNDLLLRDCMFSCRVQGKRIDEAVLIHIINHHLRNGITSIRARFIPTKRNAPAGEMLQRVGFAPQPEVAGVLTIVPASPRKAVPHVQIESNLG